MRNGFILLRGERDAGVMTSVSYRQQHWTWMGLESRLVLADALGPRSEVIVESGADDGKLMRYERKRETGLGIISKRAGKILPNTAPPHWCSCPQLISDPPLQ
jgi:hypothetical protein